VLQPSSKINTPETKKTLFKKISDSSQLKPGSLGEIDSLLFAANPISTHSSFAAALVALQNSEFGRATTGHWI